MKSAEAAQPPAVFLPWDTEFFGFRIGRVTASRLTPGNMEEILSWSGLQRLRCLYFSADAGCGTTLDLAHQGGFRFVDLRLDLSINLAAGACAPVQGGFRPVTAEDIPSLEAISRVAHTDARFFKDRGFPASRAAELYAEWIRRDFRIHRIFTIEKAQDSGATGYVTCQIDPQTNTGRIGLIAVADGKKGCGLGRALVRGALHWFHKEGCGEVKVTTQGSNVVAQRLYQSEGFKTAEVSATYHRWF